MKSVSRARDGRVITNRLRFFSSIKNEVRHISNLNYSVITGGFIHSDGTANDVDIITVISHIESETADEVRRFARSHVELQLLHGYSPDFEFPSDVVTRQQIVDAVSGRAFTVAKGELHLKEYSDEEIVANPESDYRVWLFEMISHDFDLIDGNMDLLVGDTITALRTIFLYVYEHCAYQTKVGITKLQRDMFAVAGLDYALQEKQSRHLFRMIEIAGFGHIANGLLWLDDVPISHAVRKLKRAIDSKVMCNAPHVVSWDVLRAHVASLK